MIGLMLKSIPAKHIGYNYLKIIITSNLLLFKCLWVKHIY